MKTPREEAHAIVEYCSHGSPATPLAVHTEECDAATEAIENARVDGIAVGIATAGHGEGTYTLAAQLIGIPVEQFKTRLRSTLATLLVALLFALPARAADPIPFFKPDPVQAPRTTTKPYGPPKPHHVATECAYNDSSCLREHDSRALDLAIYTHERAWCSQAIHVNKCRALYEFIVDDGPQEKKTVDDPMLLDPCTFVVSADHGYATLYSFRTQRWLVVPDEGWAQAEFIGVCDVDELPLRAVQGVQTLPGFPWVKHARLP